MMRTTPATEWSLIHLHAKWFAKPGVLKSVRPFAKIINLSFGNFSLPVLRVTFIFLGFRNWKNYCSCSIIKSLERLTVSLAEICLYETVNNKNNRTLEFEIKQSNVITKANKGNTNHWTFEQWKMWDQTYWTQKITNNIKKISLTRFSTSRISAGFGQPNSANLPLVPYVFC